MDLIFGMDKCLQLLFYFHIIFGLWCAFVAWADIYICNKTRHCFVEWLSLEIERKNLDLTLSANERLIIYILNYLWLLSDRRKWRNRNKLIWVNLFAALEHGICMRLCFMSKSMRSIRSTCSDSSLWWISGAWPNSRTCDN